MDLLEFINALKQKTGDDYFMHLEKLKSSPELIQETIDVLELKSDSDLANAICEALFVLYTDVGNESHKVCLQFIPAVIWAYYCQLSQKARGKPEALLLAFYNKCVTRNVETPFTNSFRIPKLSKPSVFHEPMQLAASATLTENALNQHDKSNKTIIFKGPTKRLDHIPSGMRNTVIATVLQEFNFSLSSYTKPTLLSLCHLVFRLSICGYKRPEVSCPGISKENISSLFNKMKVRLSAKCVQELVTALQFTSYNGLYEESKIVLDCLHQHSHYSLLYAGTLNTSALKNVLELSTSDKDFDVCPPIDPRKCGYRVKGGKTSVMTPPRPSFVNSLSIDRTMEDSNASITQTKSIASPSNVTIHIKTSSSNKTTVTAIPSIEIVSEGTDKTDGKNDIENGHTPNKRSSTYTDEDSEFENDKTPLIYCNSLSSDGSTTVVVLKSNPSSSPTSEKGQHEETPM